jgi:hypothetical protein
MKTQEQEMLQIFQVEELEKRYEMGTWAVSGSATSDNGGSVTVTGTYTF